jgi:copper resistance protein C
LTRLDHAAYADYINSAYQMPQNKVVRSVACSSGETVSSARRIFAETAGRFTRRGAILAASALVGTILSIAGALQNVAAEPTAIHAGAGAGGGIQPLGALQRRVAWSSPQRREIPAFILAHAIVVRTSPPQDGTAAADIGKVDVWYDAGIRDSLAALAVVSADGERVDKRDAAIDGADPAHVSVGVNPLAPGKYTVRYRALSADGHLVSGAWEFEVRP